jgi:exopolysaccharide biosynthesis polyprenyl glycosylphosphotransferase
LTTHAATPELTHPLAGAELAATRHERHSAQRDARYRRALAVADIFAAACALSLSIQVFGDDRLQLATLIGLPLVVLVSKVIGLYDRDELLLHKSTVDEVPKLFTLAAIYALTLQILEPYMLHGDLGRDQLVGVWALLFLTVVAGRSLARFVARSNTDAERVIVVGDPSSCARIAARLEGNARIKADVVNMLPLRPRGDGDERWTADAIAAIVAQDRAERMIIGPWSSGHEDAIELLRIAKGVGVSVSVLPGVFEVIGSHVEFDEIDGMTVLGVRRFELTRSSRAVKRGMDLAAATLALVVAAPVLAVIAAAIRLDSKGSIFFRQVRVGRDGKCFWMWKFRTMVPDAESLKTELVGLNETVGLFKIADDPRVTAVGRFLRRTSLDELPQLLNVLRGEMSLVGPRPLVIDEDELVTGFNRRRLHLTPGMTGPWQILGGGRIPLGEMVKIDYLYVTGWSLWNDVKILLRTAGYVAAGRSV